MKRKTALHTLVKKCLRANAIHTLCKAVLRFILT